jgi:heme/copper-type cytochrome/quinol oxidase subunit 1
MGVVSQILADHARRPVFGYRTMVAALGAIAVLGMLVWGHHMFTSGLSPYARMAFSLLSIAVGVPSAVKTFHWIATIWGGRLRFTTAMLFALGFVSVFVTGGLSGIILAQLGLNAYFHDTYFVVAHFHFIMGVSAVFGIFAATYYWFPKMFGRLLDERLGKLHFYLTFLGVHLVFLPMHFLGLEGNPRRYPEFAEFEFLGRLLPLHEYITWGAFATGAVQLTFLGNLIYSRYRGPFASANPWHATTLEWIAPSPPPPENFPSGYPIVDHPPYAYETDSEASDYHTQADAYQEHPTTGDQRQGLFFCAATIVMVWHAGLASALVFRRFAPDWSRLPASPALWWAAGLALAAAIFWRLSIRYPRLRLAAFPLSFASCLVPALLPWEAAQGPALWFYSLIAGSQALFSLACLYPLLRGSSQPAIRVWYLITLWWLLWAAALRLLA